MKKERLFIEPSTIRSHPYRPMIFSHSLQVLCTITQIHEQSIRLYAISPVILNKRKSYYEILEQTQKNNSDITNWLVWFLDTLNDSLETTLKQINRPYLKVSFGINSLILICKKYSAKY